MTMYQLYVYMAPSSNDDSVIIQSQKAMQSNAEALWDRINAKENSK